MTLLNQLQALITSQTPTSRQHGALLPSHDTARDPQHDLRQHQCFPVISAPADLDSPTNPTVTLYNFTAISFLLPNRQIHDEYQDYKLPRARLLVNFKGNARLRYQCCRINTAISFKADFPMDILKHVSACEVWLNWFNVKDIPSPERLLLFAVALFQKTGSFSGSQESIAWTPTRGKAETTSKM